MSSKKKASRRQTLTRVMCLVLAGIMVLGIAVYLIILIGGGF